MADALPTTPAPTESDADSDAAARRLAHLHKMSTTAGLTNNDYVAVSQTAVVAFLLGLAGLLALLHNAFLVIPVIGAVLAVVAVRQIADSGGTQSGRPIALLALAVSLASVGYVGARGLIAVTAARKVEGSIAATVTEFGQLIRDGKPKQAYALTDDDFQSRVTLQQFESFWQSMQLPGAGGLGQLQNWEWNQVTPDFFTASGSQMAALQAKLKFARSQEIRTNMILRQVGDKWLITGLPTFFPEDAKRGEQGTFVLPDEPFRGRSKPNDPTINRAPESR